MQGEDIGGTALGTSSIDIVQYLGQGCRRSFSNSRRCTLVDQYLKSWPTTSSLKLAKGRSIKVVFYHVCIFYWAEGSSIAHAAGRQICRWDRFQMTESAMRVDDRDVDLGWKIY